MIEVENLTKTFGNLNAVDGISFKVVPGEILGFLGPNGAGKSTTMKMLTGFIPPTSGRVSILGSDIETDTITAQRRIGYLPEGTPAYDEMTAASFLDFIARIRGFEPPERAQRVRSVISAMSLEGVVNQRIETLSKGFKRRVGLAQAIIHDPEVLILDEPTDGLDPNQKHQVREMIRGLSKDKIVIISTHILEEVSAVCTRAIIIARGKIVSDSTPAELQAMSPHHQAVTLRLTHSSDREAILARLNELPGVRLVEGEDRELTVLPDSSGDGLLSSVTGLVSKEGWQLEGLFQERGRLDEVFRSITAGVAHVRD